MNMMNGVKVLIVGQNPGNNPRAAKFRNHTIDRLNQWCDELGITHYGFVNAVTHQGECKIKDVDFARLKECVNGQVAVIALGVFASKCLEIINRSHFRLPHPSPRNRLMNDKEFIKNALTECKEFLENRS
jgi:uracil-DNA glycosylase